MLAIVQIFFYNRIKDGIGGVFFLFFVKNTETPAEKSRRCRKRRIFTLCKKEKTMKKQRFHRVLSVLLATILLAMCLPFSLFASAAGEEIPTAPDELKNLSAYLHASAGTTDNTVGLTVNVHTYYDTAKEYTVSRQGVEGTPVVFYVMHTNTERGGTKSDEEIVRSLLERGFFVLVLDYLNNEKAVSPDLDWSIQDIRAQVLGGQNFAGTKTYPSGTFTDGKMTGGPSDMAINYILPAGYDIAYRIPYFSYDLHGAAGSLEKIVEVWNNDFKSVKRELLVKWVNEDGTPRLDKTDAIVKKSANDKRTIDYATWFSDENKTKSISQAALAALPAEEQKSYPYTYIGNTKVTTVTDCVKPDGSFIDLNLYLDVCYPTGDVADVPVMVCMASTYTRSGMLSVNTRPQMTGFLFSGYAGVVADYGLVPMCRNDHYGYYCGNSQLNSVSGDNVTYSLTMYNGIKSDSALLRTIRKMGVDGIHAEGFDGVLKFPLLANKIGIYGNSKSGFCIRFANPNPELLEESAIFEGHLGETRLEAKNDKTYGYADPFIGADGAATDARIRLPESQPALTYADGSVISSQANLVYAQCGAAYQALTAGSAPIFGTGTQQAGGDGCSYWTFYAQLLNRCRAADIPFFGLVAPTVGHNFGYGEDQSYGIDTYYAFHRYANYWLKDGNAECMVIDVDTIGDIGADNALPIDHVYEIDKNSSIKLAFTGPVDGSEIAKVQIVNAATGEGVTGKWTSSLGNQQWKFLPYNLTDGTYYRVIVPETILAANGKTLKEAKSLTFRTVSGVTAAASRLDGSENVITNTEATYVTFDRTDVRSAYRTDLRFAVENDATNTVIVSGATLGAGETYADVSEWKTLGEVILTGSGVYAFDVTDFVRSETTGTPIFRLQTKYAAGDTTLRNCPIDNGDTSGLWFTYTAKTSVSDEIKNADGSNNKTLKFEYAVRNSSYIDLNNDLRGNYVSNPFGLGTLNYWMNGYSAISAADYGRSFRVSFRIYDTTSRLISVSVGSDFKAAERIADSHGYCASFRTVAGEWTTFSVEFRIDGKEDWEALNKATLILNAENKSIAVLDPLAAVRPREMANATTSRPAFYAGNAGLNDSYTAYDTVKDAEAAGAVTVNPDHTYPIYFDDFLFEEVRTDARLAASPELSIKPMDKKDALPIQATYVISSDPDTAPGNDTLSIGGGSQGTDSVSVKSYVQLSLDGYSGKTAALLFEASGKNSTVSVYGVTDVAAGQSWTKDSITAANAPANDRFGSGVKLSEVFGASPLATFTLGDGTNTYAVDLTDFASEMYRAGANAVTLVFVSGSAGGENTIATLDFTKNYDPQASAYQNAVTKRYDRVTEEDGNGILNIYPEATVNENHSLLIGGAGNNYLPSFKAEDVGRTIRITFRAKSNVTGSFVVGMMSAKSRQTPAQKPDGTKDEADSVVHSFVPYLPMTCEITKADTWQTFTYEFTIDAYMTEKYVNAWGSDSYVSINSFGIRPYNMSPNKNLSGAEKLEAAKNLTNPSVTLSVDDIVANEVTGAAKITLIDKDPGMLVSNKGYGDAAAAGFGTTPVVSKGNGKPIVLNPSLNNASQNPNTNQNVYVDGLINGWRYNSFTSDNVGKTYRITFTGSATEAGTLDMGLVATWTSKGDVYNITDGVKSDNLRFNFYPGTTTTVSLTENVRTYSFEFTVTEGMLPANLVTAAGEVSGSSLAPAMKFYNGFRDASGKYKDVTITLDNFFVYEVKKSAYADTDTATKLADFESDTYGPTYYYFEKRYMTKDDAESVFRDSIERVQDAENAHSGSYVSVLKSTRVNNFPFWTRLLPTSYTESERGQTYSVSFWMKATKTGQFKATLTCAYGGTYYNLNNLEQAQTFTVTEANVWKRYTYTFKITDAQLQADKPAVYFAIHPFAMGQSNEYDMIDGKQVFKSEDPVYMYFDDFTVRKAVTSLTETNLSVSSAVALTEMGKSDTLSVFGAPSVANADIKKTYLTFAPYTGTELYEAKLQLPVLQAEGQTVKVYAIYGATLPESMTYATAPVPTGNPIATFTAKAGQTTVDVTDAILAADGKAVTFVFVIEEGGADVLIDNTTTTPTLSYGVPETPTFDASTFKTKTNITLYSDFRFNLYVPVIDEVKEITLDGVTIPLYTAERVTIDGTEYYRVTKEIAAKEGADTFSMQVLLHSGEKVEKRTYTLSIPSYAAKILKGSYNDETKVLMRDMLSYISAAADYFGTLTPEKQQTVTALIGEGYVGALKAENLPTAVQTTPGLQSACLTLDATPAFVFYVSDAATAKSFRFTAGGAPLTATVKTAADGRTYIEVTTYAYGMLGTVNYTYTDAEGTAKSGAYNLSSYYQNTSEKTQKLTLALACYSASAAAYRNSVIGK